MENSRKIKDIVIFALISAIIFSIGIYIKQKPEEIVMAALSDGTFTSHKDAPENGYANDVTITVNSGRIVSVLWESYNEKGTKRVLSQNGQYVMTENGPTWAEQADALAAYVIENQGLTGMSTDEKGKTDAIASVSISVNDFIELVTECIEDAADDIK